jgi:hypothetical protein
LSNQAAVLIAQNNNRFFISYYQFYLELGTIYILVLTIKFLLILILLDLSYFCNYYYKKHIPRTALINILCITIIIYASVVAYSVMGYMSNIPFFVVIYRARLFLLLTEYNIYLKISQKIKIRLQPSFVSIFY